MYWLCLMVMKLGDTSNNSFYTEDTDECVVSNIFFAEIYARLRVHYVINRVYIYSSYRNVCGMRAQI